MIQRFYFSSRYGTYLRSEHGVKKFAEMCMAQLIRKVTKKSAFYREENENLLVEKANLRLRQNELSEQEILTPGQYFGVRRRLWATSLLLTAVVVAAILIFMISILAFVTPEAGLPEVLRVATAAVLAVVLAGGGRVVSERLIEAFIPVKYEAAVLGVQRTS
ncbi:MAG: hypothetical protein ACOCTG_04315, partial [Bacteroidota bacterium]